MTTISTINNDPARGLPTTAATLLRTEPDRNCPLCPRLVEFREALRLALLSEHDIAASQGVYNFTDKDRYGLDDRSRILLTVKDGKYVLAQ